MRKAVLLGAFAVVLPAPLQAQRQKTGLVIQSWKYDPETKHLALKLVNLSGKSIIAYNISDSDGSTDLYGRPKSPGAHLEDSLGVLINAQMSGKELPTDRPNGPLAGGATRSLILGAKDISVKAVVDLVVYADATAEVLNEHAFSQIVAMRKGHLIAMQRVSKVIKQVLADPTTTNPGAAAVEGLRQELVESEKHNNPEVSEGNQTVALQSAVADLERSQWKYLRVAERDYLKQYVENMDKRITLTAPHCQLQRVNIP
jgi:hypothetical protein